MTIDTRSIALNIIQNYYPFRLLSSGRAREAFDTMRILEIRRGETLFLRGSKGRDYLYVIEGEVETEHDLDDTAVIKAKWSDSKPSFIPPFPYEIKIVAKKDSVICHADSLMFDYLLFWDELKYLIDKEDDKTRNRIENMRNVLALQRLPIQSIAEAVSQMETVHIEKGTRLCCDNGSFNAYYILESGKGEAYSADHPDGEEVKVADITPGDVFGKEAVGLGAVAFAPVKIIEDSTLLSLPQKVFEKILNYRFIDEVAPETAKEMMDCGAEFLDIRYEMEREESCLPGSTFIPLHDLRKRMNELSKDKKYIVYCRSGRRSRVATQILEQGNIQALSLSGGIIGWPHKIVGDTY